MNPLLNWLRKSWAGKEHVVVADYKKRLDFASPMMEDLRMFCNVYETTNRPGDPTAIYIEEGKRQVYNHLVKMHTISDEELKPQPKKEHVDERSTLRSTDT